MTRYLLLMLSCSIILFFCFIFRVEESHTGNIIIDKSKDYPRIPRVTAYEVFKKFNSGKAILFHAGGESFERRHILGAIELEQMDVLNKTVRLPELPKYGVEIFIYCY